MDQLTVDLCVVIGQFKRWMSFVVDDFLKWPLVFAGIKKYVVGLIIKTSSDAANVEVSSPNHRMFILRIIIH